MRHYGTFGTCVCLLFVHLGRICAQNDHSVLGAPTVEVPASAKAEVLFERVLTDGERILTVYDDGRVRLTNLRSGAVVAEFVLDKDSYPARVDLSHDCQTLAVVRETQVEFRDVLTGKTKGPPFRIGSMRAPTCVAFSPDDSSLAVDLGMATMSSNLLTLHFVSLVDTKSGKSTQGLGSVFCHTVSSMVFSADSRLAVEAGGVRRVFRLINR